MLLVISALASTFFTIYLARKLSSLQESWASFKAQNYEKARLNSSLYATLGYGGMIHHFKNYVLRKDFDNYVKLERSMGATQGVVDHYLALSFSTAEKLALNDIQTMLDDYRRKIPLIRKEIENSRSSIQIDKKVKVDDTLAIRGLKTLYGQIIDEHIFFKDKSNKPVLVTSIRSELGYGRMIHDYKNYILRKDEKYKKKVLSSIARINEDIKKYLSLNCTAGEKTALEDIVNTVNQYKSNIELIDSGIQQNLSPEEIDAQVRIDDTYALRGLQTIDQDIINEIEKNQIDLVESLRS
jgi:hypothetical protein